MIQISEQSLRSAIRPFLSYIPNIKDSDRDDYLDILMATIKLSSSTDAVGQLLEDDYAKSNH